MSTNTTAPAAIAGLDLTAGTPTSSSWELPALDLAAWLDANGYDTGTAVTKARALQDAVAESTRTERLAATTGLLDLPAADVIAMVRADAIDDTIRKDRWGTRVEQLTKAIDDALLAVLPADADRIIEGVRAEWDAAVTIINTAHGVGITTTTTGADIAEDGTPEQLTAYRDLGTAAALLNRIADARIRLCNAGVAGVAGQAAACFVDADTALDLDSAASVLTGKVNDAIAENKYGSQYVIRRPETRTGGAWLALLEAGYSIRLATGEEATTTANTAAANPAV